MITTKERRTSADTAALFNNKNHHAMVYVLSPPGFQLCTQVGNLIDSGETKIVKKLFDKINNFRHKN